MNTQGDNSSGRVDRLLRQWGAQQSVDSAEPPKCPQPEAEAPAPVATPARAADQRAGKVAAPALSARLIAPAAAAAVLLMAVAFWIGSLLPRDTGSVAADPNELAEKQAQLAAAQEKAEQSALRAEQLALRLERARQDNAALEERLGAATQPSPQLSALREELARTQQRVTEMRHSIAEQEAAARRLEADRDTMEARLKDAAAELAKAQGNADAAEKLAALRQAYAEETKRLRRMHDEVIARARKAEQDAATARAEQKQLLSRVQAAYLRAAAPDKAGLQQRQAAARRAKLLQRCAPMARLARGRNTRQTIEQLEAVLTRLDLLTGYDAKAETAFGSLVAESGVLAGIDTALAAAEPENVQEFLLEAKLVLEGAAGAA